MAAARVATFTLAVMAMLALTSAPAAAETELEVSTPADDYHRPGSPTPLLVTISADGAVSGTLNATFEGLPVGSAEVEVPGGSVKEVVLIIHTPRWGGGTAVVTFDAEGDADDAVARIALSESQGDELVAVFPELAARNLPGSATLDVDVGVARLFPFDSALLDEGADVLSPFSQLLATPDDLDALSDRQRAAVAAWVGADGGVLVVDDEAGTPLAIDADNAAVEVSDNIMALGLGEIRYSSGAAGAGNLDGLLSPTGRPTTNDFPWGNGFGEIPTMPNLALDAGVRIPGIGALVGLLALYGIVAGPVLWFLLRRGGREPMLWLVLPALALVTTLGVWAVGRSLRENQSTAHATIVADLPTLRQVSTQVLLTSPNGGEVGVELQENWRQARVSSEALFFDGPFGNGGAPRPDVHTRDGAIVTKLDPGGIGVVGASSISPAADPSWSFDLRADGDGLVGSVTNLSGHDLSEVYVASGNGFTRIASLDAGDSAEVTLRNVGNRPLDNDPLTNQLFRNGDPWQSNDGPVNPGILLDYLSDRPQLRSPGIVMAIGWTRDPTGPLQTTKGLAVENGRTAFLSAERLDPSTLPNTSRTELLRGWNGTRVADPPVPGACVDFPVTMRIIAGAELDPDDAVLDVKRRMVAAFDVWVEDEWVQAGMAGSLGDVVAAVPAAALADGELYLRVQMTCDFWGGPAPFPLLRSSQSDDEVLALGAFASAVAPTQDDGVGGTTTTGPAIEVIEDVATPEEPTTTAVEGN